MAKIPTILQGDESGEIRINLDEAHSYAGARLVVAYQGITRTFENLEAGGHVNLVFTHDETAAFALGTFPILARLVGASGAVETVDNADMRIKVTDCIGEVNAGGSFSIVPGQGYVPITDDGDLPAHSNLVDVINKVNEIVHTLAQRSAVSLLAIAACAFSAFGASVQKADFGTLYPGDMVVTEVDLSGVGAVKSVNGKTGDVTLGADDVGAVPTTVTNDVKVCLSEHLDIVPNGTTNGIRLSVSGANLDANVDANVRVSVRGSHSLSDYGITNGIPSTAEDVHALDDVEGIVDAEYESYRLLFPYFGYSGRKHYIDFSPRNIHLENNGEKLDVGFYGVDYVNERGGRFESDWFDFVTKETVVRSIGGGDEDMPPSVRALRSYLGDNYLPKYVAETNYLSKSDAAASYETKQHAGSTYATKTELSRVDGNVTAVSNLVEGIGDNITKLNSPDKAQYINGAGEVYRNIAMPSFYLTEGTTLTSRFVGEEFRYDDANGYWFTENHDLIWALGPAAGGSTKLMIKYEGPNSWVCEGDGGFSVSRASAWDSALVLNFSILGKVERSGTHGGIAHTDNLALESSITNLVPNTRTVNNKPLSSNITLSASDVGAATPAQVQTVSAKADAADAKADSALAANNETRAIVTTWEGVIDGSNVVIVVTNYISGTYTLADGKFKIRELRDGVYREIYDSRKEILLHLADFETNKLNVTKEELRAEIASVLVEMQHDAWGRRTSTGNPAPSNTIYTTEPSFVFGGGLEYERIAVGAGAIGILADKGAPSYTAGDSGTFLFKDATGENYFGYSMTSGYALGVRTDDIKVSGQQVTLKYNIVGSCPIVMWCPALFPGCAKDITGSGWYQLNDEEGNPIEGAPFECAVDMESTPEVATVYIDTGANPVGFFSAWTSVPGKSSFKTNMPVDLNAANGGGVLSSDGQTILVPQPDGTWRPTNANH